MSDAPPFLSQHPKSGPPPHKLELAKEKRELHRFVKQMRMRASAMVPPGPNQVVVTDGMGKQKVYNSITEAMNSITDASESNQYTVTIGTGTFNEQVALKSWVNMLGSGAGQTIINSNVPAVKAAPNSAIQMCTIQAIGRPGDALIIAVSVLSSPKFMLSDCTVVANDAQRGPDGNLFALVVDWPDGSGSHSTCFVTDCKLQPTAINGAGNATAAVVAGGSLLQIETSTLAPTGPAYGVGGASDNKADFELGWCTVSGSGYALWCDSSGATCVATDCTINGAVSPNVKIIHE